MGVWTGTAATGTLVEDVDVDRTPTGIYIEHFTRNSTFEAIHVRRRVRIGVVAEWADPERGGRPASVDNVIQDSLFESSLCGVYLDEGTTRTTVRRSAFRNQRWAAVGDYRGIDNRVSDNDYTGIRSTAVPVSNDHVRAARGAG
jgi:nitrous oxidase accessory protein NosD